MTHRPSRSHRVGIAAGLLTLLPAALVTAPAAANHGARTLNVQPETANLPLGSTHVMTATLSQPADTASGTIAIDFENEGGSNDLDGVTRTTPDLTCSIPAGQSSCTVSYTGVLQGRDRWRAWIDHDGRDTDVEADTTEGRQEGTDPGTGGTDCAATGSEEPDCTDVVQAIWGTGALDCDDSDGTDTERSTNPAGGGTVSNETYTCTVATAAGRPDPGVVVKAEVENGVNDPDATDGASYDSPDYTCTTADGSGGTTAGVCRITVTQNENETGTAQICFWTGTAAEGQALCADEPTGENQETDGSDQGDDLADRVEKTWELRAIGGIDAEPENDRNPVGTQHQVTATVYDQFGAPFAGNTTVFFEFFRGSPSDTDGNSAATPDRSCTTVNASTCTLTYIQSTPGTDLICVFKTTPADPPAPAPDLQGTNNNGTCAGEGALDADDEAGTADPPQPREDEVDVVQKIWQNPTDAARLECAPERQKNRRNTTATITCTATDSAGLPVAGAEIDAEALGVNDPDDADSPTTPDLLSCITQTDGSCSLGHGPAAVGTSDVRGTTFYRAWIDRDNDNSTVEADPNEGADEAAIPGAAEPDVTDVVQVTWTSIRCDVVGSDGADSLEGTPGPDVICGFGGNDRIVGRNGADRLLGDGGRDVLLGSKGADLLEGRAGDDVLRGESGFDVLKGGPGNDALFGGHNSDRCSGGAGRDTQKDCER